MPSCNDGLIPVASDFLYTHAPLVEVIAEIRWKIPALSAIPGAFFDPFFVPFSREFATEVGKAGFGLVEDLIPSNTPTELVGKQVIRRFRREANRWPLFQIGPGVLTCNIVPPYNGWNDFRRHLVTGLDLLARTYPSYDLQFDPDVFSLRYINAFNAELGYKENPVEFLRDDLTISIDAGVPIDRRSVTKVLPIGEVAYVLEDETTLKLRYQEGQKDNQSSLIFEISAVSGNLGGSKDIAAYLMWFDQSHELISSTFDTLASEALKDRMGPRQEIAS